MQLQAVFFFFPLLCFHESSREDDQLVYAGCTIVSLILYFLCVVFDFAIRFARHARVHVVVPSSRRIGRKRPADCALQVPSGIRDLPGTSDDPKFCPVS